jgi:MSHA biogenesis protein MshL
MNLKPVAAAIAVMAALSTSGCADIPRPSVPLQLAKANDTLKTEIDQSGEAQLYLDTGYLATNAYEISPIEPGDALPDVSVERVSLTEAGVYQAMNLLTKNTDLTVSIMGGADAATRYGAVSVMNVRGKLPSVVERLSQSMGFFYSVHGKDLLIEPERQFFIEVPPALNDDNAAGMANTLQALGARDIYLDRSNRTLVLRVNRTGYDKIARYLKKIREERAMIVYEVSIFQVDLKDQNDTGVQWNKLGYAANGSIPTSSTNGATSGAATGGSVADAVGSVLSKSLVASQATGYGLGMVLNSSKFSIDSLVTFLQTQGTVKSLSSPRIAMLAGTKGSIRVGNTLTYVSKIGSNTSIGLSQISTETKDLRTGLDLALFGEVHDNTVYSRVSLSLSELVRMTSSVTLGNEQKLPETAEREIKTEIRARPGDMILLGGVTVDRSSFDVNRGLMVNGSSKASARSELVVALKPKLVHFQTHDQVEEARAENEARQAAATRALMKPALVASRPGLQGSAESLSVAAPVQSVVPATGMVVPSSTVPTSASLRSAVGGGAATPVAAVVRAKVPSQSVAEPGLGATAGVKTGGKTATLNHQSGARPEKRAAPAPAAAAISEVGPSVVPVAAGALTPSALVGSSGVVPVQGVTKDNASPEVSTPVDPVRVTAVEPANRVASVSKEQK